MSFASRSRPPSVGDTPTPVVLVSQTDIDWLLSVRRKSIIKRLASSRGKANTTHASANVLHLQRSRLEHQDLKPSNGFHLFSTARRVWRRTLSGKWSTSSPVLQAINPKYDSGVQLRLSVSSKNSSISNGTESFEFESLHSYGTEENVLHQHHLEEKTHSRNNSVTAPRSDYGRVGLVAIDNTSGENREIEAKLPDELQQLGLDEKQKLGLGAQQQLGGDAQQQLKRDEQQKLGGDAQQQLAPRYHMCPRKHPLQFESVSCLHVCSMCGSRIEMHQIAFRCATCNMGACTSCYGTFVRYPLWMKTLRQFPVQYWSVALEVNEEECIAGRSGIWDVTELETIVSAKPATSNARVNLGNVLFQCLWYSTLYNEEDIHFLIPHVKALSHPQDIDVSPVMLLSFLFSTYCGVGDMLSDSLRSTMFSLIEGENSYVDPSFASNRAIKLAACLGQLEITKRLLKDPRVDPSVRFNYAIGRAAEYGFTEVVRLLLEDERVSPEGDSNYAIRWSAANGHLDTIELLLSDVRVDPCAMSHYAMRFACGNGHIEVVRRLLKDTRVSQEASLGVGLGEGLITASRGGHFEIVKMLVEKHKANAGYRRSGALMAAARSGHKEICNYLLQLPDVSVDTNANAAIRTASENGHLEIVSLLMEHGATPSALHNDALDSAAANGHTEVVKLLLVDPVVRNLEDTSALQSACERGHLDVAKILYSLYREKKEEEDYFAEIAANATEEAYSDSDNIDPDFRRRSLVMLRKSGDRRILSAASKSTNGSLSSDNNREVFHSGLNDALNVACANGHLAVVEWLLDDSDGMPSVSPSKGNGEALELAAANNQLAVVRRLLKHPHINPNKTDALSRAAVFGFHRVVEEVIRDGRCTLTDNQHFALRACAYNGIGERMGTGIAISVVWHGRNVREDLKEEMLSVPLISPSLNHDYTLENGENLNPYEMTAIKLLEQQEVRKGVAYNTSWLPVLRLLRPFELESRMIAVWCLDQTNAVIPVDLVQYLILEWCSVVTEIDDKVSLLY